MRRVITFSHFRPSLLFSPTRPHLRSYTWTFIHIVFEPSFKGDQLLLSLNIGKIVWYPSILGLRLLKKARTRAAFRSSAWQSCRTKNHELPRNASPHIHKTRLMSIIRKLLFHVWAVCMLFGKPSMPGCMSRLMSLRSSGLARYCTHKYLHRRIRDWMGKYCNLWALSSDTQILHSRKSKAKQICVWMYLPLGFSFERWFCAWEIVLFLECMKILRGLLACTISSWSMFLINILNGGWKSRTDLVFPRVGYLARQILENQNEAVIVSPLFLKSWEYSFRTRHTPYIVILSLTTITRWDSGNRLPHWYLFLMNIAYVRELVQIRLIWIRLYAISDWSFSSVISYLSGDLQNQAILNLSIGNKFKNLTKQDKKRECMQGKDQISDVMFIWLLFWGEAFGFLDFTKRHGQYCMYRNHAVKQFYHTFLFSLILWFKMLQDSKISCMFDIFITSDN